MNQRIFSGLLLRGELSGQGDLSIEGEIEGKVVLKDTLSIEATAKVLADVEAKTILVSGSLAGSARADRIELRRSATVRASLVTRVLVIDEGAAFEGHITMPVDLKAPRLLGLGS